MTGSIYEFIVLRQKEADSDLPTLMQHYDKEARSVTGFIASRQLRSFYALPQPDDAPVFVMVYQWASRQTIPVARDHLIETDALKALFNAADITAFALTEQVEGDNLAVETLAIGVGEVLELAIRRIKPDHEDAFESQRLAFVASLDGRDGVLGSAEFRAVLGNNIERLTVGITVYKNQERFQQLATEIMANPATMQYFATFDAEALKYSIAL